MAKNTDTKTVKREYPVNMITVFFRIPDFVSKKTTSFCLKKIQTLSR